MINRREDFGRLDHGSFKAFAAAAGTLNFTAAARKAAMTQSGVSQHVARLERQLGAQLFARVGRKVRLTKAGELLLRFIERQEEQTDAVFDAIHREKNRLSGKVRYGMPHSCLFTPHFSLLLDKRKKLGDLDLEVRLCPNDLVFEKLLNREIDFGFVTRRERNPSIDFDFFCREEYVLVGTDPVRAGPIAREEILGRRFVSYPGMAILFDIWAKHQFKAHAPGSESLRIAGSIDSLHGAITMLEHGVGVAVVPRHCVEDRLRRKILRELRGPNRKPLFNDVSIVTLSGAELPRRVHAVIEAFHEMKAGSG